MPTRAARVAAEPGSTSWASSRARSGSSATAAAPASSMTSTSCIALQPAPDNFSCQETLATQSAEFRRSRPSSPRGTRRGGQVSVAGDGSRDVVLVLDDDVEVVLWRMDGLSGPDLGLVDRLARLQLAARRLGYAIRLRNPCDELRALLDLVGLSDVLPLEAGGEAERREQLGVDEVVDRRDPLA